MPTLYRRATDIILHAVQRHVGDDGAINQFQYKTPGSPFPRAGTEFFVSRKRGTLAALFLRQHGPQYLRALPIQSIKSMMSTFLVDHYYLMADETFGQKFTEPFDQRLSEKTKNALAKALESSPLFQPVAHATVFPLTTVNVDADFSSPIFFLRSPQTLADEFAVEAGKGLIPDKFPPIPDWQGKREAVTSWLGIRAPALEAAMKTQRAVLGAVSLTQSHTYRYMFTGRHVIEGYCEFDDVWKLSWGGAPSTPKLAEIITLTKDDTAWLAILADKLQSNAKADRRLIIALEYFYRAWRLQPSERFAVLCQSLDAAYGEVAHATAAVTDGVRETLGTLDKKRLRMLMELRASVIHGGAPDVYDSRNYGRYVSTYGEDPIVDLGVVLAACLRARLFGGALKEHAEPYQDIIAKRRAEGRMPPAAPERSILTPVEDPPTPPLSRVQRVKIALARVLRSLADALDPSRGRTERERPAG